jgi:hypothetical protein
MKNHPEALDDHDKENQDQHRREILRKLNLLDLRLKQLNG